MKKRKLKKRIMAIGIQRNEAAIFAKVYRKIVAQKREYLCPALMPMLPPVKSSLDYRIQRICAVYTATNMEDALMRNDDKDFSHIVDDMLCKDLARAIYHSGAITLRLQEIVGVGTRYTATVNVVMQ